MVNTQLPMVGLHPVTLHALFRHVSSALCLNKLGILRVAAYSKLMVK